MFGGLVPKSHGRFVWVMGLILTLAGCCSTPGPTQDSRVLSDDSPLTRAQFQNAFDQYHRGRYARAAELFQELVETTSAPGFKRRALWGLAWSRLAAARTDEEQRAALALWDTWASLGQEPPDEDLSLAAPVLKRLKCPSPKPAEKTEAIQLRFEIEELRRRVKAAEELPILKKQVQDMTEENQALREKLDNLEKLYQEIKQKRKTVE